MYYQVVACVNHVQLLPHLTSSSRLGEVCLSYRCDALLAISVNMAGQAESKLQSQAVRPPTLECNERAEGEVIQL